MSWYYSNNIGYGNDDYSQGHTGNWDSSNWGSGNKSWDSSWDSSDAWGTDGGKNGDWYFSGKGGKKGGKGFGKGGRKGKNGGNIHTSAFERGMEATIRMMGCMGAGKGTAPINLGNPPNYQDDGMFGDWSDYQETWNYGPIKGSDKQKGGGPYGKGAKEPGTPSNTTNTTAEALMGVLAEALPGVTEAAKTFLHRPDSAETPRKKQNKDVVVEEEESPPKDDQAARTQQKRTAALEKLGTTLLKLNLSKSLPDIKSTSTWTEALDVISALQKPALNDKVLHAFDSKLSPGDLGRTTKDQLLTKVRETVLEKASELL